MTFHIADPTLVMSLCSRDIISIHCLTCTKAPSFWMVKHQPVNIGVSKKAFYKLHSGSLYKYMYSYICHAMSSNHIKVSKESILREGDNNFPVNLYADEINFDVGGVAKITCENTSENIVDVDCWPPEVTTWNRYSLVLCKSY